MMYAVAFNKHLCNCAISQPHSIDQPLHPFQIMNTAHDKPSQNKDFGSKSPAKNQTGQEGGPEFQPAPQTGTGSPTGLL